ncbi:MAG: hypothetical protein M1154_16890 [Gammaproteobacteria bacterium]|nr:hypothetical protein [Gammaproteobacteria bacterium]
MEPLPINVSSMPSIVEMLAEATSDSAGVAVMPTVMTNQAWHEAVRQHEGEQCWVWCFMAPWEWALMQPETPSEQSWLAWVDAQRQVLQLRRLLGPQLQFVRASQLPRFLASLDQAAEHETPHDLPLLASAAGPELAATLAKMHLEMVPQSQALESAWEVFETLEAAAWLPEGAAPLFRDALVNTHVNWPLLLPLLHAGCEAPALREQVSQQRQRAELANAQVAEQTAYAQQCETQYSLLVSEHKKAQEEHQQEVAALRTQQQASQREREEVEEENALLLAQLHHVQEELETYFLNQQTLEQREKTLKDDVSQLQKRLAEQQAALDKAQSERDQLAKQQASQLQEASQQYQKALDDVKQKLQASEARASQLQAKAQSERDQLAKQQASQLQEASQQHQKALDDVAQKLQTSETRLSQQQAEQSELHEENDLLLSQLHQVQEELERYFLANREYQSAMGSARQTFTRARTQVSQLAKKAR